MLTAARTAERGTMWPGADMDRRKVLTARPLAVDAAIKAHNGAI
jgi:hypothetical protein